MKRCMLPEPRPVDCLYAGCISKLDIVWERSALKMRLVAVMRGNRKPGQCTVNAFAQSWCLSTIKDIDQSTAS